MIVDFDRSLKRPISSRYADGLFHQICRPDGKTFNVSIKHFTGAFVTKW